jgi:hypothetical protein
MRRWVGKNLRARSLLHRDFLLLMCIKNRTLQQYNTEENGKFGVCFVAILIVFRYWKNVSFLQFVKKRLWTTTLWEFFM